VRPAEIRVLTEDSAKDAHATIQALAFELFKLVDPDARPRRLRITPASPDEERAMRANLWRSTNPRDHRHQVTLRSTIASRIVEGGFVLFHFDGDRIWGERDSAALPDTRRKFEALIRTQVRSMLEQHVRGTLGPRRGRERPSAAPTLSEEQVVAEVDRLLSRLLPLVPYYSVEAWLLQNTYKARLICEEEHGDPSHLSTFDSFRADRGSLDELMKPKEATCLGAKHNLALAAEYFPAPEADAVDKSFHAAVETLRACPDLVAVLAETHAS
jgi:hypothetical protein